MAEKVTRSKFSSVNTAQHCMYGYDFAESVDDFDKEHVGTADCLLKQALEVRSHIHMY